ncbi:RNA-directed DNA polymerase, eukaryota, reverse transcriptase zinc-binding domain protein [Tanacetum coccineum]
MTTTRDIQSHYRHRKQRQCRKVLLVKLKDLDSATNMYVLCKNDGFVDLKIHHVGGSWIWIQFLSPEACENFRVNATMINISSAIRTVTPSFKEAQDSSSSEDVNEIEKVEDTFEVNSVDDIDEILKDLNNDKDDIVTSEEPRNVNIEHFRPQLDSTRKCSTSFPRRLNKDIKGIFFIHELSMLIEVGSSLGIDVRECHRSLNQLINGIGAQIVELCYMINIYGPHDPLAKSVLWDRIRDFMHCNSGKCILFGDLNEVRNAQERHGSIFSSSEAQVFNNFISCSNLIDLPLGGHSFTWMNKQGTKLSKLDRFLIPDDVYNLLPDIQVTRLDHLWLDCIPILLHCNKRDFGPVPFKIYHSWFNHEEKNDALKAIKTLEDKIEECSASNEDCESRLKLLHDLDKLDTLEAMDSFQKARIKWDVQGDENTKFFHCLINQKRRCNSIKGIMHEGAWVTDPQLVKQIFLNFFKCKFQANDSLIDFPPITTSSRLNDADCAFLEANACMEEVKDAVWDCGSDKPPVLMGTPSHLSSIFGTILKLIYWIS